MAYTNTKVHLGNHIWFAPYASGTSDADNKPATGSFYKVGPCTNVTVTPNVDSRIVRGPNSGINQVEDVIPVSNDLSVSAHIVSVSQLFWKLLWQSALGSAETQYNPGEAASGEAPGLVKAWLKIQQYDQTNTLFNSVDLWCALTIGGGVSFGESPIEFDLNGQVMLSTLNTGALATAPLT